MPSCKHEKEVDWILNTFKHSKHTLSSIPFCLTFFLWGLQTCKYFIPSYSTHWWWKQSGLNASSVAFMDRTYFDVYIVQTFYYIFLSHMLFFHSWYWMWIVYLHNFRISKHAFKIVDLLGLQFSILDDFKDWLN